MTALCISLALPGQPGCKLSLTSGPRSASFHASDIRDDLTNCVLAAVDLAEGRRFASFPWRSEPGGVFVDIHIGYEMATLVVHEMANPDWSGRYWYPERAQTLFTLDCTPRRFIEDFFSTVVSLPEQAAAAGRPVWGHELPVDQIAEIQRYLQPGRHKDFHNGGKQS